MERAKRGIAVLIIGVGLGIAPTTEATAAAPIWYPAAADQTHHIHRQPINWRGCQTDPQDEEGAALDRAGAQCAKVTVPLDYAQPDRRTITLAISRMKATDPAHRIGPLFINLGGPGNPVLAAVMLARQAMGETGARFDIIGMDPRFAGRSTPLDCEWPTTWIPRSAGADRQSFNHMAGVARDLARRCGRRHGDLLPYASTATIARDMDAVRAALNEPKLSYLGYSQGSYLGALYTQLFPHRADRVVLDSAIHPALPGTRVLRQNAPQRTAALRDWATWAAKRNHQYHIGATAPQVLSTVERIYQASARHALRVGRFRVDDTVVPGLLAGPLTDDTDEDNAELAASLQVLAQAARNGSAKPTNALQASLTSLLTDAGSALRSAQTAILCADAAVPHAPSWYWRDIQAHRADQPLFGPLSRTITPCAFWPTNPKHAPVHVHNNAPVLIVHAAGDINSTLDMGQAMHGALAGSRMITLDKIRTHGVYLFRGSTCVDDTVNTYLRTGTLPTHDLHCAIPGTRSKSAAPERGRLGGA